MQADLESQRGRQGVVSTGRGGAGNLMRSPSRGLEPEIAPGSERGREATQRDLSGDRAVRSGRGGAGNIRSPSRDPTTRIAEEENEKTIQERLINEERGRKGESPFSTGRGGAGNFSRDKSRSRSAVRGEAAAAVTPSKEAVHGHATGRGGWGNVREERESVDLEKEAAARRYEAGIAAQHRADDAGKVHSSGKGGFGNMTSKTLTPEEFSKLNLEEQEAFKRISAQSTPQYATGGRGGAGNYHTRDRDNLAVDGERGRDSKSGSGGIVGNFMRSLSRAKGGSNERARD
ncbi:uncharacterized protein MKK02DRAFT_45005 [Dioszegia hungarica]|uniref:Uncharacterized protein n=1 Tax=Dioszegia hungarica TaxID=4972 RepID=A0AA38LW87_9TREE|nr:uncharacterized protein MKK02DRAFT_45005 [Dioszegia hungarica]KAI9636301.1 hypothetical protein MKK02DRAFT_45005 [Dioszegia hungarica]